MNAAGRGRVRQWSSRSTTRSASADAARVPPHNLEAEESLLGAMLLSPRRDHRRGRGQRRGARLLQARARPHLRRASTSLYGQGEPVDPVTVAEELRRAGLLDALGGRPTLLRIQAATPASANAGALRQIVNELALLRRLIAVAGDIRRWATTPPTTSTRRSTAPRRWSSRSPSGASPTRWCSCTPRSSRRSTSSKRSTTATTDAHRRADRLHRPRRRCCSGCSRRTSSIVAARPGQGKTSFALGAALQRRARRPASRCCSSRWRWATSSSPSACSRPRPASTPASCRPGKLTEHEWPKLNQAVGRLAEAPLFIDDNPHCTVMEMRAKARRIKAALRRPRPHRRRLPPAHDAEHVERVENRQVEVSEISPWPEDPRPRARGPVMALSQLNRQLEYRQDKRPMLADLRESGLPHRRHRAHARRRHDRRRWVTLLRSRRAATSRC